MQSPRTGFISTSYHEQSHVKMAYWQWGEQDNPDVVVCVHGLTRQALDFTELAQTLAKTHRVICPDVVGRGRSDWLVQASAYSIPNYASDMFRLFEQLRLDKAAWVGTSMGGLIGMAFAHIYPGHITRLLLNDIGPELEFSAIERIAQYLGVMQRFETFEQGMLHVQETSKGFGQHSEKEWEALCAPMLVQENGAWRLHYDPKIRENFVALNRDQLQIANTQLWQMFENLSIPILVLRGEYSDLLSAQTAAAMVKRGRHTQMITIKNVGHAPSLMHKIQIDGVQTFISVGK